jgi:hypothetical protein
VSAHVIYSRLSSSTTQAPLTGKAREAARLRKLDVRLHLATIDPFRGRVLADANYSTTRLQTSRGSVTRFLGARSQD